ncbi:hypothetical protein A1Q1_06159 [Trichosporon asahii var. asahii CBS 2479]|uniref:RINT-1 family protein n=1 Tax=Trichosporon asahii var. asahii (strain ATCC 90039 / CBS 2479 / JCM 2466 / KCTC 7840 / NBRC 103889/ NCYC 2677 / UAMH 7654) TaxID=1186058 RepID=J5SFI1_TRIAS|nr:hypothetical protein A1Q1_06159 [Trichosporon asahii var. asahii CBS 2479]EJT45396.1 hypothetical protein A1Q1_06159 [Trichosporon asahii var. asahii CBS 2479]
MLAQVRQLAQPPDEDALKARVLAYLNANYPDLASLEGAGPSALTPKRHSRGHSLTKVPSRPSRPGTPSGQHSSTSRSGRTLDEDIAYWEERQEESQATLEAAEAELPDAIAAARTALKGVLERSQELSLRRYELSDAIGSLLAELDSSRSLDDGTTTDGEDGWGFDNASTKSKRGPTFLEQVEATHAELALQADNSDRVLDPKAHDPSPLAALPLFRRLNDGVESTEAALPPGMALVQQLHRVRDDTWDALKGVLGERLCAAAKPLGWPRRVDYASASVEQRRAFEYAYADMLAMQAEGERLGLRPTPSDPAWASGVGLYPLQALVEPINLRFRYHFMGSRSTNRADKPEWAFSSIRDTLVDLSPFLSGYVQPLTLRCMPQLQGVNVVDEFTMLLFPILLSFLRVRVPALLSHPALLAHTVYQCVLFDDSIRAGGFQLGRTSLYDGGEWEGLTGAVLREEGWFGKWLEGEKRFAEDTLNDIISSPSAWELDDADDAEDESEAGGPRTESARRVTSLLLQITDRYSSLPGLEFRQAFLKGVQLPLLSAYHTRISGSLDAFETLSSAFVRAVPGSLTLGRGTDEKLKGPAGLERLLKAHASAAPVSASLREWGDEPLFVQTCALPILQITDRYSSLPGLEFRQAFLKGVQLPLLSAYHTRISGSLDAFETLSSAFVRAVPGSLTLGRGTDEKLKGPAGLERLLKAHASAAPVSASLREWGDEPLFVSMSAELGSDTLDTGVWDGMADKYSRLAYRAEDMAVAQASSCVETQLRTSRQNWVTDEDAQLDSATVAAVTEYSALLRLLPRYLAPSALLRVYRRFTTRVVAAIAESIAYAKFNANGGAAFLHLVRDWVASAHDALSPVLGQRAGLLDAPWRRLEETARILALPSDSSGSQVGVEGVTFAQGMAAAWGGEEAFASLQDRLGVRDLTRDEVQDVLRKREECWR